MREKQVAAEVELFMRVVNIPLEPSGGGALPPAACSARLSRLWARPLGLRSLPRVPVLFSLGHCLPSLWHSLYGVMVCNIWGAGRGKYPFVKI